MKFIVIEFVFMCIYMLLNVCCREAGVDRFETTCFALGKFKRPVSKRPLPTGRFGSAESGVLGSRFAV